MATDSEVGDVELDRLAPVISRTYSLAYDPTRGETCVSLDSEAGNSTTARTGGDGWS
jgi:hypothetical protein